MTRTALLSLLLVGCVADRPLRTVDVTLATLSPADDIELHSASLGIAAVVLEGPALVLRPLDLVLPLAHAHPGHGATGAVVGELLGPGPVDLLHPPARLGVAEIYAGAVASGRIRLDADVPLVLEGTARHPDTGAPVAFSVHQQLDAEVTGLTLEATVPGRGAPPSLQLTVDLDSALSFVDWSSEDLDADGRLTEADGTFRDAVTFGLVSTHTWSLTLETP